MVIKGARQTDGRGQHAGGQLTDSALAGSSCVIRTPVLKPVLLLVCVALLTLLPAMACAQEKYELTEGQWQQQAKLDPSTPEGQLQAIRQLMAKDEFKSAQKQAAKWIDEYPNHPKLVEAYLLRADAKTARHHYYKALYDYEYIIRTYPASEQFETALKREYSIAQLYVHGMRRRLWGMRILAAQGEGEEILIRIQERSPGSELGEKASLALGDYYFSQSHMGRAAIAYDLFLQNYPASEHREGVLLRLIQASLATFKGPEFDSKGLLEAAQRIKQYQQEFPASAERIGADALLVRIDESLALKAYKTGKWFQNRGRHVSAVVLYQRIIRDHPQTSAAHKALAALRAMGEISLATAAQAKEAQSTAHDTATQNKPVTKNAKDTKDPSDSQETAP